MSAHIIDPLVSAGERFALDAPGLPEPADTPDGAPVVFGLRFTITPNPSASPPPDWWLDPESQIALTPDGTPWYRTVKNLEMSTTGPSSDGGPSTGGEEWKPDYQAGADCDLLP